MNIFLICNLIKTCMILNLVILACCDTGDANSDNKNDKEWWFKRIFHRYYNRYVKKSEISRIPDHLFPDSDRCDINPINNENGVPDIEELVKRNGYILEKHEVETEDGYFLTLFRLKPGESPGGFEGRPVIVLHGSMDSSVSLLLHPKALGNFLVDEGYDVWIPNPRGTYYSRKHKDPEILADEYGSKYWDFSFHEVGEFDLPAVIDEIIRVRKHNLRIHFIGVSQGTTVFFVMGSVKTEYLQHLGSIVLLAPIARIHKAKMVNHKYFVLYRLLAWGLQAINFKDLYSSRSALSCTVYKFCQQNRPDEEVCKQITKTIPKPVYRRENPDFEHTVITNQVLIPTTASVKTYLHYLQIAKSGHFRQYDLGKGNVKKYGQRKPKEYELGKIYKMVSFFKGEADEFLGEEDIDWLRKQLPLYEMFRIDDAGHFDYARTSVFRTIVEEIFVPAEEAEGEALRDAESQQGSSRCEEEKTSEP